MKPIARTWLLLFTTSVIMFFPFLFDTYQSSQGSESLAGLAYLVYIPLLLIDLLIITILTKYYSKANSYKARVIVGIICSLRILIFAYWFIQISANHTVGGQFNDYIGLGIYLLILIGIVIYLVNFNGRQKSIIR